LNCHDSPRPATNSAELQAQEINWWNTFAELEDRYAWVQTPALQSALRGHYLREIIKVVGKRGTVLDLGCGTGWLSLALAREGATNVTGVDFSASQIALANAEAARQCLSKYVRFQLADATTASESMGQYDCVIAHGFLHHLFQDEIRQAIATAHNQLNATGTFIVFEPVRYSASDEPAGSCRTMERRIEFIKNLANRGARFGLRRISKSEREVRNALAKRNQGIPPHGPSPKEIPFCPGELEEYLRPFFVVARASRVMAMSHQVTQEWLLRGLSHPVSTSLSLPLIAWLAAKWDTALASSEPPYPNKWLLTMLVCEKIKS
jgi:SAM-dependent methyltransferase